MEVSRVFRDFGNKYRQPVAPDTPFENVTSLTPSSVTKNNQGTLVDGAMVQQPPLISEGIRMEDYGAVRHLSNGGFVIVVCDGHGAVPLTPTRWIGGFESAKFVTHRLLDLLEQLAYEIDTDVDSPTIPKRIRNLFRQVQDELMQEYEKGAEPVYYISIPEFRRVSLYPEAADPRMYEAKTVERRKNLTSGAIDGHHFREVMDNPQKFFQEQSERGQDPRAIVTDKILLPIPDPRNPTQPVMVAFYTNMHDELLSELDYGCTCTAALVLPTPNQEMRVYVAHVGDSDAYIFPSETNHKDINNNKNVVQNQQEQQQNNSSISLYPSTIDTNNHHDTTITTDNVLTGSHLFDRQQNDTINDKNTTIATSNVLQPQTDPDTAIRVVADHTISNPSEVLRLQPYGVQPRDPYFQIMQPPTVVSTRAIMPSRTFGHSLFRHYGLISDPHVSTDTIRPGDTLVVGTDGLWDERWNAKQTIRSFLHKYRAAEDVSSSMILNTPSDAATNSHVINQMMIQVDPTQLMGHIMNNNNNDNLTELPAITTMKGPESSPSATLTIQSDQPFSKWLDRVGIDVLAALKNHLYVQDNIAFVLIHLPQKQL